MPAQMTQLEIIIGPEHPWFMYFKSETETIQVNVRAEDHQEITIGANNVRLVLCIPVRGREIK